VVSAAQRESVLTARLRPRRGKASLGCLFSLLILVAIAYFAFNVGEVYLRAYRFEDAMKAEARFAGRRTDDEIKRRLRARADSLGLPEGARTVRVRRTPAKVIIWAEYYDPVELPLFVKDLYFNPQAEGEF
jgi:hypothetical protein